jgi:regulator of extracellular matrix RemA (YlzA/DUF370 family)
MLVNIGYSNMVMPSKFVAVLSPETTPLLRLKDDAPERNALMDAMETRRMRSITTTDRNNVILSAVQVETLTQRFLGGYGT